MFMFEIVGGALSFHVVHDMIVFVTEPVGHSSVDCRRPIKVRHRHVETVDVIIVRTLKRVSGFTRVLTLSLLCTYRT